MSCAAEAPQPGAVLWGRRPACQLVGLKSQMSASVAGRLGNRLQGAGVGCHDRHVVAGFGHVGARVEEQAADAELVETGNGGLKWFALPQHPLRRMPRQQLFQPRPGGAVGRLLGFKMRVTPLTERRLNRFRGIKRGYWSFIIITTAFI